MGLEMDGKMAKEAKARHIFWDLTHYEGEMNMIQSDFRFQIGMSNTDKSQQLFFFFMADIFTCTGGANDTNDGSASLSAHGAMPVSLLT